MKMSSYKEIVTKAVIGKGKKYFKNKYDIDSEEIPSTILGCWIINHKFNGYIQGEDVKVDGSFDINLWYSYDNDTKTNVINKTINYSELINVKTKIDADFNNSEIIVRALKQPTCSNVQINGNKIDFDIEKELGIEVVGDEKVKIMVEDDEDKWEVFDEEDIEEVIDNEVEEDFLK
ncbi:MAG: outer spore coat protein CotE [Bacilli bacterium]|nr:outer spore coat protein CotE [Bacilli bacterium]